MARGEKNSICGAAGKDGLQAGVSRTAIDVACRYFSTEKRKFIIIADTPGMNNIPGIWRPERPPAIWRS